MDSILLDAEKKYVSLADASALLQVSKATLRNWDKAGKLTAIRHPLNSYRLYDVAELKRLQEQLTPSSEFEKALQLTQGSLDTKEVRRLISKLGAILRNTDSQSNIISRFDEITKLLFAKVMADRGKTDGKSSQFEKLADVSEATTIRSFYKDLAIQHRELIPSQFSTLHISDHALVECANALRFFNFDMAQFDVKGLAYEEVIRNTFDKGDHQQFFTPPQIVDFIVSMCAPFICGSVCDPASGTGGFLASVARHGMKYNSLTSIEIDERLSWVSGINMLLHEGRSIRTVFLPNNGTLGIEARPYFGKFDIIVTNPPFGSDFTDRAALDEFILGRGKTSRRRGVLFIERCHSLLRANGTLAIILDEGVLNLSNTGDVRQYLIRNFDIKAIISLPETAFMPYANVNASVLILNKSSKTKKNNTVFFAKAETVGRKANGDDDIYYHRDGTSYLNSDLPTILKAWQDHCSGREVSSKSKIFVADVASNLSKNNNGCRLDFQYHHPSRQISQKLIAKCSYTLRRLGDICTERNTIIIPSKELADTVIRYTGLANIESENGIFEQVATPANSIMSAVKAYKKGDILFAKMRPNLRKVAFVDFTESGYVSPECAVLTVKNNMDGEPVVDQLILSVLLRSDFVFGQIMHLISGIGRPRIGVKELREVMIPIPPKEVQEHIRSNYIRQREIIENLKKEVDILCEKSKAVFRDSVRSLAENFIGDEFCDATN